MYNWIADSDVKKSSMSSDWDNRWRTGGSVEEVVEEAHLSPEWIWQEIRRFAEARAERASARASAAI